MEYFNLKYFKLRVIGWLCLAIAGSIFFSLRPASARRVRVDNLVEFFPGATPRIAQLNRALYEYMAEEYGVSRIFEIRKFQRGREAVQFDLITDAGPFSIIVKPAFSEEAQRMERASEIGVSPKKVSFIELTPGAGYIAYKHFEGQLINEISNDTLWENMWIFSKLGKKIAKLDNENIAYFDWIWRNILINLEQEDLVIIDYSNHWPGVNLSLEVLNYLNFRFALESSRDYDPKLYRQAKKLFIQGYREERVRD